MLKAFQYSSEMKNTIQFKIKLCIDYYSQHLLCYRFPKLHQRIGWNSDFDLPNPHFWKKIAGGQSFDPHKLLNVPNIGES